MSARGPDDDGVEAWSQAVLGHCRLSIVDLSQAGHQPMLTSDRKIGVVFNGAIYNFRELRAELEVRGHSFRSKTDTEVLVNGYLEWGIDKLVSKLQGMFAFGIWDDQRSKLYLVRDRLGVKPLVYCARGGSVAFASSVKALRAAGFGQEIDLQAVTEYLEWGYVSDDRSIYQNVAKVPAATIVECDGGNLSSREYWSLPRVAEAPKISFEEAVKETERILVSAVSKRLFADVPVGTLLSAGIDSTLISWAVKKLGGNLTAFTVSTPGDPWDESKEAEDTARVLKIRHRVLQLSSEQSASVAELVSAYGEPFACASALGMLGISRLVRGSAKVLLTGDGGDDVFLGYPEHRHLWMAQQLARALPAAATSLWTAGRRVVPKVGLLRRGVHFLDYSTGGLGAFTNALEGLPAYRTDGMLGERLDGQDVQQRRIPWSQKSARSVLTEFLVYDRKTRFVGEYMTKVDGATMHHGLEARSPFLDQELWEFAAALPYSVRLRGGVLKAVLRAIAARRVGKEVARRKKRGFGVPVYRWMVGPWRKAVEEQFRDSALAREGLIRADVVLKSLEAASRAGWAPKRLWYLYVLESWYKQNVATSKAGVVVR